MYQKTNQENVLWRALVALALVLRLENLPALPATTRSYTVGVLSMASHHGSDTHTHTCNRHSSLLTGFLISVALAAGVRDGTQKLGSLGLPRLPLGPASSAEPPGVSFPSPPRSAMLFTLGTV